MLRPNPIRAGLAGAAPFLDMTAPPDLSGGIIGPSVPRLLLHFEPQAQCREALQDQRHRAPGKAAVDRDRPRAAGLVEMKRKDPLRFPHRQPSPCHRSPLGQIAEIRAVGRHRESLQIRRPQGVATLSDIPQPAPPHHQGEGHTAKSGKDSVLARARSAVKCCHNPGQIESETRSDRIRTGGQINGNPHPGGLPLKAGQRITTFQ